MVKLANYQIRVTNPQTGNVSLFLPLIEAFGLKFERKLNQITSFALTLPYEARFDTIFRLDAIVDIFRSDPNGVMQNEGSFLTRMTDTVESDSDSRFIVSGYHANHLLKRRYIDPADDSVQPNGGYATKAGSGGAVIRAYIREQAADLASTVRQTLGLTVPVPTDNGNGIGGNFRYENLWDEMVKLAETADLEIEVRHTGNRQFQCIIGSFGTDRSIAGASSPPFNFTIFDPKLGNLGEPRLVLDRRNEVTFVRVQGGGARNNRINLELTSPEIIDSVYNRIEQTTDSRGVDDTDAYQLYLNGLKFLIDNRQFVEFESEPLLSSGGAVYRTNFEFGDRVTVKWNSFEQTLRVASLEFTLTSDDELLKLGLENER
jgi:hypothetical protein